MLKLKNFKEIKSRKDLPEYNTPVLAYFPNLSASGFPFDVVSLIKDSYGDHWGYLTDMRNRSSIAHYKVASHWIYLKDIVEIPSDFNYREVEGERNYGGGYNKFEAPTTANPMGFHDGY